MPSHLRVIAAHRAPPRPTRAVTRPPVPRPLPPARAVGNQAVVGMRPTIRAATTVPAVQRTGFDSTVEVCHRVRESRRFPVEHGGVRVVLIPRPVPKDVPNCTDFRFGVTLNREKDRGFDPEIGTCEAETGGPRTFTFAGVGPGTYYLTIWRTFEHPYCCLEGDIVVVDEAVAADSPGCRRGKDLTTMDIVHGALDVAGFIPVLGALPDGINAAIYVAEGDWTSAGLSAIAMVPAWGDGVKLGAMAGRSALKFSEKAAFRLDEEGIAKGLKEAKLASVATRTAEEAAEVEAKLAKGAEEAEELAGRAERQTGRQVEEAGEKAEKEAAEKAEKTEKAEKGPRRTSTRCTPEQQAILYAAVEAACHGPGFRCSTQADTCASATAKVAAANACIAARQIYQSRCWHPKDPGYEEHMRQIANAGAALRRCFAVMSERCRKEGVY